MSTPSPCEVTALAYGSASFNPMQSVKKLSLRLEAFRINPLVCEGHMRLAKSIH